MDEITAAHRVRLLQRLMGDDPTEEECFEMWGDRPRLERLLALQDGTEWPGPDHNRLQAFDFELWRAKVRTKLGSLTGVLDALAICHENNLILPDWLIEVAQRYLTFLGLPEDAKGYKQARSLFKEERRKLKMQKRAEIVHKLYMLKIWPQERARDNEENEMVRESFEAIGELFRAEQNPPEVEAAIQSGAIPADFKISSIFQAAEIAHIALRGTWAQASVETIRQDYTQARVQLKAEIKLGDLSRREEEFIYWDVAFVRPETLKRLGITRQHR